MKLSVYRRAVKMRWPKSYRDRQVFGEGRWLVVVDERGIAYERGYKGFIWTSVYLLETRAEAEDTADSFKNDGAKVQIVDCEELSTFTQAKRVDGYLLLLLTKRS